MSDMKRERPLSPHLSVYRFRPTMAMSILHRMTGSALYIGTLLVAWWLIAAANGPEKFATVAGLFDSIFGRFMLFCYSWALLHHMLGGIRHLIWDTGNLIDKENSTRLAVATLVGSMTLTALLWIALVLL